MDKVAMFINGAHLRACAKSALRVDELDFDTLKALATLHMDSRHAELDRLMD